jgi:hypothetical protein
MHERTQHHKPAVGEEAATLHDECMSALAQHSQLSNDRSFNVNDNLSSGIINAHQHVADYARQRSS